MKDFNLFCFVFHIWWRIQVILLAICSFFLFIALLTSDSYIFGGTLILEGFILSFGLIYASLFCCLYGLIVYIWSKRLEVFSFDTFINIIYTSGVIGNLIFLIGLILNSILPNYMDNINSFFGTLNKIIKGEFGWVLIVVLILMALGQLAIHLARKKYITFTVIVPQQLEDMIEHELGKREK